MKPKIDLFEQVKNIAREFDKAVQDKKTKDAVFFHVPDGDIYGEYYLAANGIASLMGAKLSKMKFRLSDMSYVRAQGITPRTTNGEIIGKVNISV